MVSGDRYGLGTALFSNDKLHRLRLSRIWNKSAPRILFIMLNPSTANEYILDPTVKRCVKIADSLGFGSAEIVNIFSLRATDPKLLYLSKDPTNRYNDLVISKAASIANKIVVAWGINGNLNNRGSEVSAKLIKDGYNLFAFGYTRDGNPKHPLYLPGNTPLVSWHR